jgi:hypothetical protein
MKRFSTIAFLMLIVHWASLVQATTYIRFWVNGDTAHVLTQGDIYAWEFDVQTPGGTVNVDFYLDLDASQTITGSDLLLERFTMTDGESKQGEPSDSSTTPDGILYIQFGAFGFAPENYLLRVIDTDESSVTSWFAINAMASPAAQIHGKVYIDGISAPDALYENVMINASSQGMFSGLTDDQGNYTINLPVADATWRINVLFYPKLSGYIPSSPDYEQMVPSSGVDSIDFYFNSPSAWLYGDLIDQDEEQVLIDGWMSVRNNTLNESNEGQIQSGHYNIPLHIVPQGDNTTNYFRIEMDNQMFMPNYLAPNLYQDEFPISMGDSLQKNIVVYAANSRIYGYIYEQGGPPSQSYMFSSNSETVGSSWANSDPQDGYFELPVRSGYIYYVGLNDDPQWGTPPPPGYVISGGNWRQASPGDTVRFYLIAAESYLQGSILFDEGDPTNIDYDRSQINAWEINTSSNYGARIAENHQYNLSVLNGNYNVRFQTNDNKYLAMPTEYNNITVLNNTVDTLDFMLNYTHAYLTVKFVNAPVPMGWNNYSIQTQGIYPYVYSAWANIQPDTSFNFNICEGDWVLYVPFYDPNYDVSPSDTVLHVTEQDSSFYVEFVFTLKTGIAEQEIIPQQMYLKQNYPNPFNPSTQIEYGLPDASQVKLTVYNLAGQKVAVLIDSRQEAGRHIIDWQPSQLASGIYLYRLETETMQFTKKLVLLR